MKRYRARLIRPLLALALSGSTIAAPGASLQGTWDLKEASISYTVNHPLKKATGTSRAAKGKVRCTARDCEALVAIAVNTFDSGDSNRDLHMLETTRGAAFPLITVRTQFALPATSQTELRANLQIEFAGEKASIEGVVLRLAPAGDGALGVTGQFTLRLSEFKITPPSLLGMAVKNDVPVVIRSVWRK